MSIAIDLSHFLLPTPLQISFSGGRTSGLLLWAILQANGGKLPDGTIVTFFNTGREKPQTLDFVEECSRQWGVPIVWLEYDRTRDADGKWHHTYSVVDYATASRKGEPFRKLIVARSYLPNVVARFCTAELKVRIGKKYLMSQGWEHWNCVIGIRADEPGRISLDGENWKERWSRCYPLAEAGVGVEDVMAFWAAQPFDLQLRQDQGNCDLCFLKGKQKLLNLIKEDPSLAVPWVEDEAFVREIAPGKSLAQFNKRFGYAELVELAVKGGPLFANLSDEIADREVLDCACTD